MATDPFPQQLPTLDKLGVTDLSNVSPSEVATEWLDAFSAAITQSDVGAVVDLFLEDGFWKDLIALTWDLRTFEGRNDITKLLDARLAVTGLRELQLLEDPLREPVLRKLLPDLALVRFCFGFTTMHGKGTSVVHLAPLPDSTWKAYVLLTCLDALTDFPEKVGPLRNSQTNHGTLEESRHQEIEFSSNDPTVLVIGAGHSGLETAARLKYIGVPTLIIDKKPRVGDNWRDRYKALCLHDSVWYDQTPYLNFPSTWPLYSTAGKLADWLEGYAKFLELNVWTASTIKKSSWNDTTETWTVEVNREGKETRTLTVKHLVFATGLDSRPTVPDIPGKASFKGSAVHSSQFTSAANYIGKKAVVVGACTSGHDIAQDFFDHGIDVTMYQRSSTFVVTVKAVAGVLNATYRDGFPVELADTYSASLPHAVVRRLCQRIVPLIAQTTDKDILDGLAKVGFKTNLGPHGTGGVTLFYGRVGGHYIDTGTCQHIINGDIKIKNGSAIEGFTENGLRFSDGTELHADIIVFATGFGDHLDAVREACGDEVVSKVGAVWGMDNEGQLQGVWRHCGHDGLWFAIGHMALSRFHSLHLAMQIKAIEEGILNKADVVI
ncbi:FAD/NAD(P)-binding domain-containing protein [Rhizopogon vinicolor AM-OR11-026]|uniref:FAD/NAD(P)-binding domain-containing protein n=1 Tax=Rhizopogon vinicolor AM-OR11-026 TaxID=1314800 RepID=A0A1B7ML75_9AGAM|nr:FAD/NAD(P)-binding domain-containing protein [Rhizopogon vinicolor AM-OR11-026]